MPTTNLALNEDVKIVDRAAVRFGTINPDGTPNRSATARAILREWDRTKDLNLRIAQYLDSLPAVQSARVRKPAANRSAVTA